MKWFDLYNFKELKKPRYLTFIPAKWGRQREPNVKTLSILHCSPNFETLSVVFRNSILYLKCFSYY